MQEEKGFWSQSLDSFSGVANVQPRLTTMTLQGSGYPNVTYIGTILYILQICRAGGLGSDLLLNRLQPTLALLVGRSHTESNPLRPLWPAVSPGQPLLQGRVKLAQATPVLPFDQHEGSGTFLVSITKLHQIIRKSLLRAPGMGASAESPSSGLLRNAV